MYGYSLAKIVPPHWSRVTYVGQNRLFLYLFFYWYGWLYHDNRRRYPSRWKIDWWKSHFNASCTFIGVFSKSTLSFYKGDLPKCVSYLRFLFKKWNTDAYDHQQIFLETKYRAKIFATKPFYILEGGHWLSKYCGRNTFI